jgi:transcriptional regulator with XRE-family HTH domain
MQDIKETVAKNIATLRKSAAMTQLDLAERLNYSDKAVSKWERAESLPDITTLLEIADLFGVPLDALVRGETKTYAKDAPAAVFRKSRVAITALALSLVWLCAVAAFILFGLMPSVKGEWLAFVVATPVSSIVWLVLNSVWFNRRYNYLIISLLVWSLLATAHLVLLVFGYNVWQVYLLGVPGQVIILIWSHLTVKVK